MLLHSLTNNTTIVIIYLSTIEFVNPSSLYLLVHENYGKDPVPLSHLPALGKLWQLVSC